MSDSSHGLGLLRDLVWHDLLLVGAVLIGARLVIIATRWIIHRVAERAPPSMRLKILGLAPKARLIVDVLSIAVIIPVLIEPTFRNTVALIASVGLALAFAFKDYGSCLIAGLVTIMEGPYQPGDWIEIEGTYGEVKSIGLRAVHLVTADDTEVIIPHSQLWSASIHNATSSNQSLLCVTNFYLQADHDGKVVQQCLEAIAKSSTHYKHETSVSVIAMEKPWGTLYKLKAYVAESREQFLFISDLTVRGKAALRSMNVRFAQAPYAELESA